MSERSVFDHKTISFALKDLFRRIQDNNLQIEISIAGRASPYVISGVVDVKFYSNGLSVESLSKIVVIPYNSILFVELNEAYK